MLQALGNALCHMFDQSRGLIHLLGYKDIHVDGGVKSYSGVMAIIMAWEANVFRTESGGRARD